MDRRGVSRRIVILLRKLSRKAEGEKGRAGGNGDVLLAIDGVRHGSRVDGSAALEVPENFAGGGVERHKIAISIARENEAARSRKHAGPRWREMLQLPLDLTRGRIDRANRAGNTLKHDERTRAVDIRNDRSMSDIDWDID